MTSGEGDWTTRGLVTRVAALQVLLGSFLWGILGWVTTRQSWLLEADQTERLRVFFVRDLPVLGGLLTVVLPAVWMDRLADEASLDVDFDEAFVARLLGYPRKVALVAMTASVVLFFFGAVRVREALAPPIEAVKIASFGIVSGILFAIFSYFLLQPIIRPLLRTALSRGAGSPTQAGFPLTQKLIVGCLAVSFVVATLFGELALFRAQRFAEKTAQERSTDFLQDLAARAAVSRPRDAPAWKKFLSGLPRIPAESTVFAMDSYGHVLGFVQQRRSLADLDLLRDAGWLADLFRSGEGWRTVRIREARVATVARLYGDWSLAVLVPPDRGVFDRFVSSVAPVAAEVFLISIVLAIAIGRSLTRPLRDLERETREFARDQERVAPGIPPTDDEIGLLVRSSLLMQDEIRAFQTRLRESERLAATAELLAGVAHEVRNPLFGITTAAGALDRVLDGDARVAPHLELIGRESRRLARMMEEMLALQRVPPAERGPVPIRAALEAAAEGIRARHGGSEILVTAPEDLVAADADRDRIQSVFSNLLENAVLASDRPVRVECRAAREGRFVVIDVEDDGPGIRDELRARLFEPFVTSRPGGTGIGLAICRQVVQEHAGSIRVSSRPGSTVFSVRLPAV